MPELPDITIYCEALERVILHEPLEKVVAYSPFLVRSVEPPLKSLEGHFVIGISRLGKRIVLHFDPGPCLIIHLMISGRLLWKKGVAEGMRPGGKNTQALLQFMSGHLLFTEVSTKRRASLTVVASPEELPKHNPGGIEPLECSLEEFRTALTRDNRTLKRALTQPSRFSGIGNAYSDEILHAAKLSPLRLTQSLKPEEIERLYHATQGSLIRWTEILRAQFKGKFPGKGSITAFRADFAAHGRFGKPCPVCGKPIQRISYAENETNYCAQCQNEGRLLADRALSRLLKDDWPRTLEELIGEDS